MLALNCAWISAFSPKSAGRALRAGRQAHQHGVDLPALGLARLHRFQQPENQLVVSQVPERSTQPVMPDTGNDLVLDWLNAPDAIVALAAPYLQWFAPALMLEAYNLSMASVLRAHLFSRDSLKVMIVMHSSHLLLAAVLMRGWGEWDGMGLEGYALAMLISRALGLGGVASEFFWPAFVRAGQLADVERLQRLG